MDEPIKVGEISDSHKGISNTTIAMLLVLALIITIIGTWAVMNSMELQQTQVKEHTNIAQVTLNIQPVDTGFTSASGKADIELNEVG